METYSRNGSKKRSRPARGAWIEMLLKAKVAVQVKVAPRKGRVD